jgi:hypothetical protein
MKASFTRAEKPPKRAEKQTLAALFTEVPRRRRRGVLRTSPVGNSRNFWSSEFSEVRYPQATPK